MSDQFIVLINALAASGEYTRITASNIGHVMFDHVETMDENWIRAALLAGALAHEAQTHNSAEIESALMLLTPEQFAVIIDALADGRAEQLVERAQHERIFPDTTQDW